MRITIAVVALAFSAAASGQTVYKCQQPDGTIKYQAARCAGERIEIQTTPTAPEPETAATAPETGLRKSEQDALQEVRQREEADMKRYHERALQKERIDLARERIQAERERMAQLRAQHCARYPNSSQCR